MATSTRAAGRQHRWISLTEQTGIVLSEPVLADIAAAGFPQFDKKKLARFHKAREIWNLPPGMTQGDPQAIWISFILEEVLEIPPSYWLQGAEIPAHFVVSLTHQREVLRPSRVLKDGKEAIMLFLQVPRHQSLDSPWAEDGAWKASPTTKLERLLRETGVEVGLVTNGESWRLITASPSETASWLTWTAQTWGESPSTLSAFAELLGSARFFAGPKDGTILELVRRSRKRQADVADKLGKQAREALEVFIRALDIADNELDGKLLDEYSLDEIFEASAVFLMRLLFLLKAEESGLLPHGNVNYDRAYGVLHLLIDLENRGRISPEKLFGSYEAYAQLLSTFRLIHDGCVDSDINVTAYGGRLFDPMEFPLLEGRKRSGMWAVPEAPTSPKISDAVIREVLRSLKYARSDDGLVQLVSYQTLEVEQIGHMYEGLLELKLIRAPSHSQLLLLLPCEKEPFPTIEADALLGLSIDELIRSLSSAMSRPPASIATALEKSADRVHSPKLQFTGTSLDQRLDPVLRFVRNNGVVRPNGLYIHSGNRRHDQGAVYTPPTITEPMVRRALQPLLRRIDGKTRNPVLSASPQEILRIRVCDPAMGSGAFLVQAIRYLSECLVEAWDASSTNSPGVILTMPLAKPSDGSADELLLPESREERLTWARRFVAETCVYGVDVNPLAIEMGKLSIWLTTLARNKAFTFVDHALRLGNSVLGLDLQQLVRWHLDEDAPDSAEASKVIRKLILEAAEPRYELARLAGRSTERKKRELLKKAGAASLKLGISADLLTSAWLTDGTKRERTIKSTKNLELLKSARTDQDWSQLAESARHDKPASPLHWAVAFPDVFLEGNGFDVVVGNPPYVRQELLSDVKPFLENAYKAYDGSADLYIYFYELGLKILRPGGRLSLIVTNKWMKSDYGEPLRKHFLNHAWVESIIDLGHAKQIFEGVDVSPCILFATKPSGATAPEFTNVCVIPPDQLRIDDLDRQIETGSFEIPRTSLSSEPWQLEPPSVRALYEKLLATGVSLATYIQGPPYCGVKTGLNEAYLIDGITRNRIIERDPGSSEIILPFVRGRDVQRWTTNWSDQWMIVLRSSENYNWPWSNAANEESAELIFKKTYPGIFEHLEPLTKKLKKRSDKGTFWWELRSCAYYDFFTRPKILYQAIQFLPSYALDSTGYLTNNKVFFIPRDDRYLLGILNSPVMWWLTWRFLPHLKDEALNPVGYRMEKLPVPAASDEVRLAIETAVNDLLSTKAQRLALAQSLRSSLEKDFGANPSLKDNFLLNGEKPFLAACKKDLTAKGRITKSQLQQIASLYQSVSEQAFQLRKSELALERAIAANVNKAYSLSDDDLQVLAASMPPRAPTFLDESDMAEELSNTDESE